MAKKKNVIARVGNFEFTKDSGPEHDYLRIKAISGSWGLTYRDDNEMYGKFLALIKEDKETLERTVVFLYTFTNMMVDTEFVNDFCAITFAMKQRKSDKMPKPTEQEEAEAIAEVEMLEEVKKTMSE